jgi:tetratricopeptide (TPR) repeat protein
MVAALATFGLTFSSYFYPGETASLFAQWMGMDALSLPVHPLWASIVKMFAGETYSAAAINMLSLSCGVLSAGMLSTLVAFFVRNCVVGEDTIKHRDTATNIAAVFAGFVFITSTAVWQGSTHLEYRMFETFFALLIFMPILLLNRFPNGVLPIATLVGAAVGVGIVEDAIFFPLISIYGFLLSVMAIRCGKKFYFPVGLFLLALAVSYVIYSQSVAKAYLLLPEAEAGNMKSTGDVVSRMMLTQFAEMKLWFSRFDPMLGRRCPCFIVILLSVIPFLLCGFTARKSLNHNRTWSDYIFHIGMTVCAILATATGISPESLLRPFGIAPIATSTLVAATCGYLASYWYLISFTKVQSQGVKAASEEMVLRTKLGKMVGGVFATILVFNALVNSFRCAGDPGAFADICANEAINKLEGRSWVVTDGLLDDHLRVVAASKKYDLNLVCLQRDMDEAYLKELATLVRSKKLASTAADLSLSVQLGVLPFIQDWFSGDTNILKNVAIFGVPDLWSMADCTPVPENIFFGGVRKLEEKQVMKVREDFLQYWERVSPYLDGEKVIGSRSIFKSSDALERLRLQLRRHAGFIANNIGVVLQDVKKDKEAFEMYELVRKTIDPDNVCALLNEFEMARAGVKEALARKNEINKELKAIVDDPKRRYQLYSLSRYYGYIRSPEIFARMGFAWARSGQTGSAIAQVRRAINFVPEDRQAGLLNMMAAIYANSNDSKKSREVYEKVLEQDANNHDALMGLSRLAMQKGAFDDAKKFLSKAVKAASNKETSGFDNALLNLLNGDLEGARMSLQKVTDLQPKSLQAWSLLAGVLLQQIDQAKDESAKKHAFEELEGVIIPKMESIASSPRDYYVQMTRALVYMRKGTEDYRKRARTALVSAFRERPEVTVIGEMILNIDISLNDTENALKHGRMILRRNRQDKLANYVMGSIRLREGDYVSAETFLRLSCQAENPIPAAQNDLAEVLRRLQRYSEAETFARAAVKSAPKLYVAWETLGSTLLDQKKDLDEAERCVLKAIELTKAEGAKINDIRMQITLARVQIAKGDRARARGTLRSLMSHQKELSKYEYGEFERLLKLANEKK